MEQFILFRDWGTTSQAVINNNQKTKGLFKGELNWAYELGFIGKVTHDRILDELERLKSTIWELPDSVSYSLYFAGLNNRETNWVIHLNTVHKPFDYVEHILPIYKAFEPWGLDLSFKYNADVEQKAQRGELTNLDIRIILDVTGLSYLILNGND